MVHKAAKAIHLAFKNFGFDDRMNIVTEVLVVHPEIRIACTCQLIEQVQMKILLYLDIYWLLVLLTFISFLTCNLFVQSCDVPSVCWQHQCIIIFRHVTLCALNVRNNEYIFELSFYQSSLVTFFLISCQFVYFFYIPWLPTYPHDTFYCKNYVFK